MKKNISINLYGQIFHLDASAYTVFEKYLNSIKDHFSSYEESDEIIQDIEDRIAEKFSAVLSKKKQVITKKDVEKLMAAMGSVKDFSEDEQEMVVEKVERKKEKKEKKEKVRRLFRDPDNKVVAGVCSGLAAYFGIDIAIMRAIFLISLFLGGVGFIAYIVLWIVMPEAKTISQKTEMTGAQVTLKNIAETLKNTAQDLKPPKGLWGSILNFLRKCAKIAEYIFIKIFWLIKPLFKLIGALTIPPLLLVLVVMASVFFILYFDLTPHFIDIPFADFPHQGVLYAFWGGIFGIVAVPIIAILFLACSLMRGKWLLTIGKEVTLLTIWMISIVVVAVAGLKFVPEFEKFISTNIYETKIEERNFENIGQFKEIFIFENFDTVTISQSKETSIRVIADEKCLDLYEPQIRNRQLSFENDSLLPFPLLCKEAGSSVKIDITTPDIKNLYVDSDQAGDIIFSNVEFPDLSLTIYGAGVTLHGKGEKLQVTLGYRSRLQAFEFPVSESKITTLGDSAAQVFVTKRLEANAFNQGTIEYQGSPQVTSNLEEKYEWRKPNPEGVRKYTP